MVGFSTKRATTRRREN